MKVKDLLNDLNECLERYGNEFLEWDIAVEQHPRYKKCPNCNKTEYSIILNDYGMKTLFIKPHADICAGVHWFKQKIYGINIHF